MMKTLEKTTEEGGALLYRLIRSLSIVESDEARCCGLTNGQCVALLSLRSGAPVPMGDVASSLGVSPGTATRIVDNLVRDGLVERMEDEEDRRRVCLRTTSGGEKRIEQLEGCFESFWRSVFERIPQRRLQGTLSVLNKVVKAVEEAREGCCPVPGGLRAGAKETV